MLVLTRKHGEKIVIDGMIEVTVSELSNDRVKLAFHAPRTVAIHRKEVFDRIERETLSGLPARPV